MKHRVLISPADSKLIDSLNDLSVETVFTHAVDTFIDYEKYHADMQILRIYDTVFVYECVFEYYKDFLADYNVVICENPQKEYPFNVSLNAALVGNKLFCKESALDNSVRKFCVKNNIEIIDVRQGYTKCSTLVLNDNSIITADKAIYEKAVINGINALRISSGNIRLTGANYGFIGGASGVIGDTVCFFGDILAHPDGTKIIEYIENNSMQWVCLTKDALIDVGGFVLL
ncbi:MAG: hypothetical protein Q4D44_02265 [Eubacteriales bacterium]|nr:hypothetical protein [Eubacteriales bacterium]